MKSGLEELGVPLEIEPVEGAVSIDQVDPHVVGEVPVDHRRQAPQPPSADASRVEVDEGQVQDRLPGASAPLEHGPVGRYRREEGPRRVIAARLPGDEPGRDHIARLKPSSLTAGHVDTLPVVLPPEQPGAFSIVDLSTRRPRVIGRHRAGVDEIG